MRIPRIPVAFLLLLSLAGSASAGGREYDPRRAGHPLRIAAYVAHPVGVILDWLIFRPAWYIGRVEPIRTLVGRDLEPRAEDIDPLYLIPGPTVRLPEPQP